MQARSWLRVALWLAPAVIVLATVGTDWSAGARLGLSAAVVVILALLLIASGRGVS